MKKKVNIFWFRRDLRLSDNHGLFRALTGDLPVLSVFIFDSNILERLAAKNDARVNFIYRQLQKLKGDLEKQKSSVKIYYGNPSEVFRLIVNEFEVKQVFANKDYEPYGIGRDKEITRFLKSKNIVFNSFKDHVIFEENEVVKDNGDPYTVFTPYYRKWSRKLLADAITDFASEQHLSNLLKIAPAPMPDLEELGFSKSSVVFPGNEIPEEIIRKYEAQRDFPSKSGTTRLGIHLRFGTVSIRELAKAGMKFSDVFLKELTWRDFYSSILWHFPGVAEHAFKPKYEYIEWRNNEEEFELWREGKTGYPLVDAGMRELKKTGFMHNRIRMVVASFLSKHLLIDWRWGEAWFAEKLLDFELASNNGNWQWAAGCGCDAAPYFRIFNPEAQQKKFDPAMEYIKSWVEEFGTRDYPSPIVDHKMARERALHAYKSALK